MPWMGWTDADVEKLRQMREENATQEEIAEVLGCNARTVKRKMRALGMPTDRRKFRSEHGREA